jgi:uncharacterized membrane-anchored protein YitT (DUF2179 family)
MAACFPHSIASASAPGAIFANMTYLSKSLDRFLMDNVLTPKNCSHLAGRCAGAAVRHADDLFGIILFRQAGALTGGTAGMAFLIHYATHLPFGVAFFAINLPFYWLSVRRMGAVHAENLLRGRLVSLFSDLHGRFIHVDRLNPYYATLFGNIMVGIGFVVLFRHKASLGGVNILALYLQDKSGIRAGKFQMVVDACIVTASLFFVSLPMLAASIVGAVILNSIIAMNHRPGRYAV